MLLVHLIYLLYMGYTYRAIMWKWSYPWYKVGLYQDCGVSIIYRCCQFYWWSNPEKSTDLSQFTDKRYKVTWYEISYAFSTHVSSKKILLKIILSQFFIYKYEVLFQNKGRVRVMMFNATFNNISVISWGSVLLVEETGLPTENRRPVISHWQTKTYFYCWIF